MRFSHCDFADICAFGYLKHFPVDFLKIDGRFVREILHDPIDREMVRSINEIGHLTGKQTIAEFAENVEIIQMLSSLGVDYAEGYGVAQPQRVLKSAVAEEANPNRMDSSTARTCLVMLPIEMQSTPVSATLRTVSSVTLPDASTVTRW